MILLNNNYLWSWIATEQRYKIIHKMFSKWNEMTQRIFLAMSKEQHKVLVVNSIEHIFNPTRRRSMTMTMTSKHLRYYGIEL